MAQIPAAKPGMQPATISNQRSMPAPQRLLWSRPSRARGYLRLGRLDDAFAAYDTALKIDLKKAHSLYDRGIAELRKSEVESGNGDLPAAKLSAPPIAAEFARYGL